jgi:hypothetical protein
LDALRVRRLFRHRVEGGRDKRQPELDIDGFFRALCAGASSKRAGGLRNNLVAPRDQRINWREVKLMIVKISTRRNKSKDKPSIKAGALRVLKRDSIQTVNTTQQHQSAVIPTSEMLRESNIERIRAKLGIAKEQWRRSQEKSFDQLAAFLKV